MGEVEKAVGRTETKGNAIVLKADTLKVVMLLIHDDCLIEVPQ